MLTACGSSTQPKRVQLPTVSEQARAELPELQQYKTGTKKELLTIGIDTANKFHDCKAKHGVVVQEYRNLEKAVETFNAEVE